MVLLRTNNVAIIIQYSSSEHNMLVMVDYYLQLHSTSTSSLLYVSSEIACT